MKLGEIIKQYREEHCLSMGDFSKMVGCSKTYISMLERNINNRTGKGIKPSYATMVSIAKAMGCSVEELFSNLDDEMLRDITGALPCVSAKEKILLNLFDKLDNEKQSLVLRLLAAMI